MSKAERPDVRWELTTFEGSRREQLRRARELTLRERLQAVEEMAELSERLRLARERKTSNSKGRTE
jgi:CRISPR-associated protein Csx17